MKANTLKFSTGKTVKVDAEDGFSNAILHTFGEFQRECLKRLQRGEATVVATVAVPEEGCYFGIVLAGPFWKP